MSATTALTAGIDTAVIHGPDRLLKTSEVADILNCNPCTVHRLILAGALPAVRLASTGSYRQARYRIAESNVLALIGSALVPAEKSLMRRQALYHKGKRSSRVQSGTGSTEKPSSTERTGKR